MTRQAAMQQPAPIINGAYDVKRIRADFPALAMQVYGKPLVYLDNAASAQNMNAVIGVLQGLAATTAGTTTFSAAAYTSGQPGATIIEGRSYDAGAALQAQQKVASENAANAEAIRMRTYAERARVASLFQRNTIEPGEGYVGLVVFDAPDGPCRVAVSVSIGGEIHKFVSTRYKIQHQRRPTDL